MVVVPEEPDFATTVYRCLEIAAAREHEILLRIKMPPVFFSKIVTAVRVVNYKVGMDIVEVVVGLGTKAEEYHVAGFDTDPTTYVGMHGVIRIRQQDVGKMGVYTS